MDERAYFSYLHICYIFLLSLYLHPAPKSAHSLTPVPVLAEAPWGAVEERRWCFTSSCSCEVQRGVKKQVSLWEFSEDIIWI